MKILLLYTYNQGFLSSFFTELAERLSKDGHEVFNLSLKTRNAVFNKRGVQFKTVARGGYFKTYGQVFAMINNTKPDVILSNFSYVNPALLFGRLLRVKKNIVWFHSLNEQTDASPKQIFVKRQFLKLANLVIANSELTKNQLYIIYKVSKSKLKIIPFWTNIKYFESSNHTLNKISKNSEILKVGCPGRLIEHKNQKVIIEALWKLSKQGYSNIKLYLAGNGKDRPKLEMLAKTFGINSQVVFLDQLSREEMIEFYKSMDLVILPSLHEAFGLVFIEAISLSIPTLVSETFGALTFLDFDKYQINNFTFNPRLADSLVEKLLPYIENKGLSGDYFKTLYQENFDKEIIYNNLRNILTN